MGGNWTLAASVLEKWDRVEESDARFKQKPRIQDPFQKCGFGWWNRAISLYCYIPQTSLQSDAWYIEWLWIKARFKALTVCGFFVFVFWYTMLLRVVNRKEKKHYCESFFLKADKSQFYHNPSHHIFNFSLFLIFLLFKAGQNILSFFHLRYHIRF